MENQIKIPGVKQDINYSLLNNNGFLITVDRITTSLGK